MSETVLNSAEVFKTSGMIDQIRDTAGLFVQTSSTDKGAARTMVAAYTVLRSELRGGFSEAVQADFDRMSIELESDASFEEIHFAAALLSRFADVNHQVEGFVIADMANAATLRQMAESLQSGDVDAVQALMQGGGPGPARQMGTGNPDMKGTGLYL